MSLGWPADRRVWFGFWPDPVDEPAVAVGHEPVVLITPDGAVVRGIW